MILKTIFAPKWQHRNPSVRKHALQGMDYSTPETQSVFTQVVNTDLDKGVRLLVIKRLLNTDILKMVSENDIDDVNREAADLRYRQLLAGRDPHGENLERRCERIQNIVEQSILEFIAIHGEESTLRLNAVNRVTRQSLLGDIAIDDDEISVRQAALEHVVQLSTLGRVAKNARRRDKRIHALAQSRLDQLAEKQRRPEKLLKDAKFCCSRIDALIQKVSKNQTWSDNEYEFTKLENEWASIRSQWAESYGIWDETLDKRVAQARLRFSQQRDDQKAKLAEQRIAEEKSAPIVAAKRKLCERLVIIIDELSANITPSELDLQLAKTLIKDSNYQWKEFSTEAVHLNDSNKAHDALLASFEDSLAKLESICKDIHHYIVALQEQRRIAACSENLLSDETNILEKTYWNLNQQWTTLRAPKNYQLDITLHNQISDALTKVKALIQTKNNTRKNNLENFRQLIVKLESALNIGQAKQAIGLANSGRNLIKTICSETKQSLRQQGELQRFEKALIQIDELQDWRKWSNEPVKRALCESMEQLRNEIQDNLDIAGYDFNDAAERIKAARGEWKEISAAEANPSQALWIRFDEACTAAYEPCHDNYIKQAKQRDANLNLKQTACHDLEKYFQQLRSQENKEIDWKALENIIHIAQQEWKSLGEVDLKQRQRINKRFYAVVDQLRTIAKDQQEKNAEEKQLLINRATHLAQSLDEDNITLREAISTIKQLQANWKTIGRAIKDGAHWRKFREPCDAIFKQRDTEIMAQAQQQQAISDSKTHLCETIESETIENFCPSKDENKHLTPGAIETIKQQWAAFGIGQKNSPLEKRFRTALQAYEKKYHKQISTKKESVREQQTKHITLCQKLEQLLWDAIKHSVTAEKVVEQMDQTITDWEPAIDSRNRISQVIHKRFQQSCDLLHKTLENGAEGIENWLASLETSNTKTKEILCLKMEIICGVDSPSDAKQARLEYQVSTLAGKMLQNESEDIGKQIEQLHYEWHSSGIIDPGLSLPLESRFFEAGKTLDGKI